jgi:integrase
MTMTGTLRKRGETWTYQFQLPHGTTRKTVSKGGYRTKREAQAALTEALASHQSGTRVEPSKLTVAQYLEDHWLPTVRQDLKPSTFNGYEAIVKSRIIPHLGGIKLTNLTGGDVGRMLTALSETGNRRGKRPGTTGLSKRSLRNTHTVLHSALAAAVKADHLVRNPVDKVKRPKASNPEMSTWTIDELRAFLAATAEDRWGACWHLALMTGLRRGELVGLRWSDVDLDASRLSVWQSVTKTNGRVVVGDPKSESGKRPVSLDAGTVAVLRRWRRRQLEERMAWGEAWEDSGYVFTTEDGRRVDPESLAWWFAKAVRTAGVPVIRFHDLRHTHATQWLANGGDMFVLQRRLGHHSITITVDRYGHLVPGQQEEAAARVAAAVMGGA